MAVDLIALILVVLSTFIGAIGALFLKKGSKEFKFGFRRNFKNKGVIGGALLYLISVLIYVVALKRGELSILYPIASLIYIWISLLSVIYLKEKMNFYKWIGVFVIIIGVVVISLF